MTRYVKEGKGWRLGWDGDAPEYPGLIAGEHWALELTAFEFQDFCDLAQRLAAIMYQMAAELMEAERIVTELETEQLWLEAEGFPHGYSLHIIVLTGRRGEGHWEAEAVSELLRAIPELTLF